MKTKTLINKIIKAGFAEQVKRPAINSNYQVVNGNTLLSFHDQDGFAVCLKTKPVDNYGDINPFNGNCYNFFHSSMRGAIEALNTDYHGRKY